MTARFAQLTALLSMAAALHAQTGAPQTEAPVQKPSNYQLYGGYAYLSNSFNGEAGKHHALSGWDTSIITFPGWHGFRFAVDVFGYLGTSGGASQKSVFVMSGPQWFHRFGRESAFLEALAGDGKLTRYWGPNAAPGETASFATVLGGGLDTPISKRFAFRFSGGYQWAHFGLLESITDQVPIYGTPLPRSFGRISSGLVWNF